MPDSVPMIRMSDVQQTAVHWLWYPYIPFGKKKAPSLSTHGISYNNFVLTKRGIVLIPIISSIIPATINKKYKYCILFLCLSCRQEKLQKFSSALEIIISMNTIITPQR